VPPKVKSPVCIFVIASVDADTVRLALAALPDPANALPIVPVVAVYGPIASPFTVTENWH